MPWDAARSDSGLYLDKVDGLNLDIMKAVNDCSNGSLWDLMDQARTEAILAFRTDFFAALSAQTRPSVSYFQGLIGQPDFQRTLNYVNAMLGDRFYGNGMRGGIMTIKRIGLAFEKDSTFNLGIYNQYSDTELYIIPVDSKANKMHWNTLAVPIELPMADADAPYYIYDFLYAWDPANNPKDNRVNCGCGGAARYMAHAPVFDVTKDEWSTWVMATGIKGNYIQDRKTWDMTDTVNGIILDVSFKCDTSQLICQGDALDFVGNPIAMTTATALRFKAAEWICGRILSDPNPNRYTMSGREQLATNAQAYLTEYNSRIAWLANEVTKDDYLRRYVDCLACQPALGFRKTGILS